MVVDASVVLEVLLRTPDSDAIAERVLTSRERLHAEALGVTLLTRDQKLARATGTRARIELA